MEAVNSNNNINIIHRNILETIMPLIVDNSTLHDDEDMSI